MKRAALAGIVAALSVGTWAYASLPAESPCGAFDCLPEAPAGVKVKMKNTEGEAVLNSILTDTSFWGDAYNKTYDNKVYDEIRLKPTDSGYVPMITGEGERDFDNEVVSDIIFKQNTRLPKYMSGAKAVLYLGSGFDSTVGAEYRDSLYVLDLTIFYGTFPQRMYRKTDAETGQTVLWFEKIKPGMVDAGTYEKYQATLAKTVDEMDKRWPPFGSVIDVTDVYGMFIVEPGKSQKSRVTFVSKLTFGDDAGWVAKFGSQLPGVLRAGLRSGFSASVALAGHEQDRRNKAKPAPAE